MYLLTPTGIEQKSSITLRFLKSKMHEFELLQQEIEQISRDIVSPEELRNIGFNDPLIAR
jgi:hypothetical protein